MDLTKLTTETRNKNSMNLDQLNSLEIATLMNQEDAHVLAGIQAALPSIAQAIDAATKAIQTGGRILYCGAGTSGRLGLMDAVECPPTFGVNDDTVIGLMAGSTSAFQKAVEGAEDHPEFGVNDLKNIHCNEKDLVVGLAASGRTPYVIGALDYAKSVGATTVSVACNPQSEIGKHASIVIEVVCGPEVLTGSTRLKAGTAQKMVCNMISTGAMVKNGKAYENLMVDLQQTNEKLVVRAETIIMEATGCNREEAEKARIASSGKVKVAIVMILSHCTSQEAEEKLTKANGFVRAAL